MSFYGMALINFFITREPKFSLDLYRRGVRAGELPDPSSSSDEGEGDDIGEGVPEPVSRPITLSNGVTLIDWARRGINLKQGQKNYFPMSSSLILELILQNLFEPFNMYIWQFYLNRVLKMITTERFTDLGMLNFPTVVRFKAQANLQYCPSCLKKFCLNQKVVKIDPKIIILSC